MRKLFYLLLLLLMGASTLPSYAQQANPNNIGSVKGLLQDTVHKYSVKSATISLYRSDSTLINYSLSNTYGEFSFKNLPLNSNYYIEVSHISYNLLRKSFSTSKEQPAVDLKTLILKPREVMLKEVVVGVPPVQMNGDTLEFNASAFKLDSNAVVEDLLRKIPNITLWGDGLITVNGREVKSLLVNGKEFFGGDLKMATQNISKNALQKIQVYNTQKDQSNPLDSSLTMNLKLKKGNDKGHFGKIGGGYGTTSRFEGDGSLNFFTPKMQLGFIGATNNTNKIANNMRALTANSTFKNAGINVEYQPDFRATGINRTNTGGATFSYNFIEKPTYQNKSELTANYFVQDRDHDVISNSVSSTTTNEGNTIFTNTNSSNNTLSINHNYDTRYSRSKQNYQMNVSQAFALSDGQSRNFSDRNTQNQSNETTSTNHVEGLNNYSTKNLSVTADYRYSNYMSSKQKIRNYNARYSLNVSDSDNERTNITEFTSFVNPSASSNFNRRYNNNGNSINQTLFVELPDLKRLLLGDRKFGNISFGFNNDLNLINTNNDNRVADWDNATKDYSSVNTYLTNDLRTNTLTEAPSVSVNKSYFKRLSNRFYRNLSFQLTAKHKLIYQDNKSDKSFRNINRNYSNFIPLASIQYYRTQYGEYSNNFSVRFTNDIRIPNIDQLAPLTDSADVYRLQRGNLNLREAKVKDLSFNFYHSDLRSKNTLNYYINASVNLIDDSFADSSYVDQSNRRIVYVTNINGYRSANLSADLRKALKLKQNALQINLNSSVSYSKNPGYVNEAFNYSNNLNSTTNLSVNYTYKGAIAFEARETYNYSQSKQRALQTEYQGNNLTTNFSGSYNVTKKFTLNSNISLNNSRNVSFAYDRTTRNPAVNYNIWNASAIYRFMKGNNAEFKFTALDLLRQNKSIINSSNDLGFTFARRNVLQQYFMTTFSYYPRQFGKNGVKK